MQKSVRPSFNDYVTKLYKLGDLMLRDKDDSKEGRSLRNEMEVMWYWMPPEDKRRVIHHMGWKVSPGGINVKETSTTEATAT